jgi:putative transposase
MISNNNLSPILMEELHQLASLGFSEIASSLERIFNELMKMEREQVLHAGPYERTEHRQGYANGFKDKKLNTRVGILNLKVPQTRNIEFYPSCLEKGDRTERALKLALAEMYVQGVSTRRVKKITEELCGQEFSSSQVSRLAKILDEEVKAFQERPLGEFRFVYLDAHVEKVRCNGQVVGLSVLKAIGVRLDGIREVLGISAEISEAEVHWRKFLVNLQTRGMHGVQLFISDDHAGLRAARIAVFPSVPWQRCLFHLAQNAQQYAPTTGLRKELGQAVRDIYQAASLEDAERVKQRVVAKYQDRASKFCEWLEEALPEGLTFFTFPKGLWKRIRTVNIVERLNEEIRRRTKVARLFGSAEACERLVGSISIDIHEEWSVSRKYLILEEQPTG